MFSKPKLLSAVLLIFLISWIPFSNAKAELNFKDVSDQNPYYYQIYRMAELGVIKGYDDGYFRPKSFITRGHAAVMIDRIVVLPKSKKIEQFKDVPKTHTYFKQISAMQQAGIYTKDHNGNLSPNEPITRKEIAKAVAIAFELKADGQSVLEDVSPENEYYEYIQTLYKLGIMRGDNVNFKPDDPLTREHFTVVIERALSHEADSSLGIDLHRDKGRIFINGKEVHGAKEGFARKDNEVIYLPIKVIVERMGGTFITNSTLTSVEVTLKDGTSILLRSGSTNAIVNGKLVDNDYMPIIYDDHPSIPAESFSKLFGYNVEIIEGNPLKVYIGKPPTTPIEVKEDTKQKTTIEDPKYPFPEGWLPPATQSRATGSKLKDAVTLSKELGLIHQGNGSMYFRTTSNPHLTPAFLIGSDKDGVVSIYINYWKGSEHLPHNNKVPYIMRETLKFYLGDKHGKELYDLLDLIYSGDKEAQKSLSHYSITTPDKRKVFKIGDRLIELRELSQLIVFIGEPGKNYDENWEVKP